MSGDLSDGGRRALVTGSLLSLPMAALALSSGSVARAQGGSDAAPPVLIPSFAQATSIAVPAGASAVITLGYRQPGDGGGGLYQPAPGSAAGPGLLKTADGHLWRLAETRPNPRMFGAAYAEGADDTQALRDLLAYVEANRLPECDLLSGVMRLGGEVRLPVNVAYRMGDLTLDFSGASGDKAAFPDGACVNCDGGRAMALPALAGSLAAGADRLSFAGTPPLQSEDLVVIYNPANFSYSGARPYYRAGEVVRVVQVTGSDAILAGGLFEAYDRGAVQAWKPANATLRLVGRLSVVGHPAVDLGMQVRRLRDVDLSGLTVTHGALAALQVSECYHVTGLGLRAGHTVNSGKGDDYGLVVVSCQDVDLQGQFHGYRHGVATGAAWGRDGALQIPCRLITLKGVFASLHPTLPAVGIHGNTEFWKVEGDLFGGITMAGDHGEVRGLLRLKPGGVFTVYGSEMKGATFLVDATHICPLARPQDAKAGLIDFGGQDGINSKTQRGGVIRLRGVIDAPQATTPVQIANYGYAGAQPISVDLNGLVVVSAAPGSTLKVGLVGPQTPINLDLTGFVDQSGAVSLHKGPAVRVRGVL